MKTYKNTTYDPITGHVCKDSKLCTGTCSGGYIILSIDSVAIRAHRLAWFIMTGKNAKILDHINGIKTDNRWCNLREVTSSQNALNSTKTIAKSGLRGIRKRGNRYEGRVMVDYKETSKMFGTLEDAIKWRRDELARRSAGFTT